MAKKSGIRDPLRGYIGGPWALLAMVVLSVGGLIWAALRKWHVRRHAPVTVPELDMERFSGLWYEIARFPHRHQRGCVGSSATYVPLEGDRVVRVINRCRLGTLDGPEKVVKGKAWVTDPEEPGKWKVRFFWPFTADYWVVELTGDYKYAVVSTPDRNRLWILSREPRMSERLYDELVSGLEASGFDTTKLVRTTQPEQA